jgi:hypothetical protein
MTDNPIQAPASDPQSTYAQNRALRFVLNAAVWAAWIFFGLVCSIALVSYWEGRGPYEIWQTVGPIQVLGGPDTVWVFAEEKTQLAGPGPFAAPPTTVDCRQVVVIFDANGIKERIQIPEGGPTFHPNVNRIVRESNDFFLVGSGLYRWQEKQFELIPEPDAEAWLAKNELSTASLPVSARMIDNITMSNSWKHLYEERSPTRSEAGIFRWKNVNYEFQLSRNATMEYRLLSSDPIHPIDISVLSVDFAKKQLTSEQAEAMR